MKSFPNIKPGGFTLGGHMLTCIHGKYAWYVAVSADSLRAWTINVVRTAPGISGDDPAGHLVVPAVRDSATLVGQRNHHIPPAWATVVLRMSRHASTEGGGQTGSAQGYKNCPPGQPMHLKPNRSTQSNQSIHFLKRPNCKFKNEGYPKQGIKACTNKNLHNSGSLDQRFNIKGDTPPPKQWRV